MKYTPRRLALGLALALGSAGLAITTTAQAAVIGDLTVSPSTGTSDQYFDLDTEAACPAGTQHVKAVLTGPGIPDGGSNLVPAIALSVAATNPAGGHRVQLYATMTDVFTDSGVVSPSGTYTISFVCFNDSTGAVFGDFTGQVGVTPSGTNFKGNYTFIPAAPSGVQTTTTLGVAPASPVTSGTQSTLTATVSESAATGSVAFKDGAATLATVPVAGGAAAYQATLSAGSHNLTAVFTSSNPDAYQSSTSAVKTYVVVGVPTLSGAVKVGGSVTCTTSAGGSQAFSWLVDNVAAPGYTSRTTTVPAAWFNKNVACKVTVTHEANSVSQTSAASKVALGAALKNTKKPTVSGKFKVGKSVKAIPGAWSPAASSFGYQWFRGAKAIKGATKASYKLTKADKGKAVKVKVTAKQTGYADGSASSASKKVS